MTFEELLNKFTEAFPSAEIDDYRPVYPQLFQAGKFGITIWLKNGDMVVYYPKTESEKKSCNTCKNSDDEFSGECYECVKDIQNHYEPEDKEEEIWCTECPYFKYVADDMDDSWYGAKCNKDGHEAEPSMYAVQSLHDDCPLKKESEEKNEGKRYAT